MATGKTSDKRKGSAVKAATRAKAPVKATAPPALSPFEEMDVLFDRLSRGLMSRMGFPALGEIGWPFQAHAPKVDVIDRGQELLVRAEPVSPDIDAVERPEETLKKMLLSDSIKHFQKDFLLKNGIYLDFRKDAAERVQEMAQAANRSIKQLCGELFHDYAYGIRLMSMEHFTITREAVENPQAYLDNYIRENYKKN